MLFVPDDTRDRIRSEARSRSRIRRMLETAGLRPTRQRVALGEILFRDGHRHLAAEDLHAEATDAGIPLSLATVYNTLTQFEAFGLIRKVNVNRVKALYDTDPGDHHHFYIEEDRQIIDIPPGKIRVGQPPEPPPGYVVWRVDVVIRLRRIGRAA